MFKFKLTAVWLPLALLGTAAAQGGAHTVYFVFRLATTLPVTLQATPECAAERAEWTSGQALPEAEAAASLRLLETYSFVSAQSAADLRRDVEAYAHEHNFAGADLWPQGSTAPDGARLNVPARREFSDPAVPGYRYEVRVYERPEIPEAPSALCITVRTATAPDDVDPALPSDD